MSVSISDFWRLLAESRLVAKQQVQQLAAEFGRPSSRQTEQARQQDGASG